MNSVVREFYNANVETEWARLTLTLWLTPTCLSLPLKRASCLNFEIVASICIL
jgi:hypothetical protein